MTSPFESAVQAAVSATHEGRLQDAARELEIASRLDPASAVPYYLHAANLSQEKKNDEAEAAFISCLARAPDFAMARFQLGLLQLITGRPAVAQATWLPLTVLGNESCLKHFVQGFRAILAGDKSGAEREIQAGLGMNADNPALNKDMRGVLQRLAALPRPDQVSSSGDQGSERAEEVMDGAHFLIANYRQS